MCWHQTLSCIPFRSIRKVDLSSADSHVQAPVPELTPSHAKFDEDEFIEAAVAAAQKVEA